MSKGQQHKWERLTRADIRTFDREATQVVLDAMDAGWVGRLSRRGHVILRSPVGGHSMSVSRDSLRGRSGRNQRAILDRLIAECRATMRSTSEGGRT